MTRPRVIVIGGGPAGSLAAALLARGGAVVTLIEQSRFPRDKVCGECLSALGRQVLRRHDLEAPLLIAGRELTHAHLFGQHAQATVDLPEPMLGLSRSALDDTLLNAAIAAGVRVIQPARAEAVESNATAAAVRVRCLSTNAITQEVADYVLAADGRAAFANQRPTPTNELGLKAHFRHVDADPTAITLYGGIGCYGGVAPIEGDRWNTAFSVPRSQVAAARGDLDAAWQAIVAQSDALRRHFRSAERVGEWLAAPLPRFAPLRSWPHRIIPIGASACAIEPVGGEGMGTALRSAELAALALLSDRLATLHDEYAALWNRRSLFCRLGGWMLAGEELGDCVRFADLPAIGRAALWAVGK